MNDVYIRKVPVGQTEKSFVESKANNIETLRQFFNESFIVDIDAFDSDTQFEILALEEAINELNQRINTLKTRL